ncbi:MAG TPA: ClpX C4-type zinc finger protein [Actinomycetota bacterium]|nr:ClpX C4-type zinc finger protein [Actinomycetota bacterium]
MDVERLVPRLTKDQVQNTKCGFCGKGKEEVKSLIVGLKPDVAICDECTEWCWEIVSGQEVSEELLNAPHT